MSPGSLVETLRAKGVLVGLRGEDLHFLVDEGRMTPTLRAELHRVRHRIESELGLDSGKQPKDAGSDHRQITWREVVARAVCSAAQRAGLQIDESELAARVEAIEERAAILEFDAGFSREAAEEQALDAGLADLEGLAPAPERAAAISFVAVCDLSGPRHPHDPPVRGCHACGSSEFVRVDSGPAYFCTRCHPPLPGTQIVEKWTAPEPSLWRMRRG